MGYAMIDNRVSGGTLEEHETVACRHCRAALRVQKFKANGAWCSKCWGPVCPRPQCAAVCVPSQLKLDRAIEARYRREKFAETAGLQTR